MIFTYDDFRTRLRLQPFQPMRIVTTTGEIYDVRHPDQVLVGRRFIEVPLPPADEPFDVADQFTRIALVHVAELRDLPRPVPSNQNGSTHS